MTNTNRLPITQARRAAQVHINTVRGARQTNNKHMEQMGMRALERIAAKYGYTVEELLED
jgi:hypothetical protein